MIGRVWIALFVCMGLGLFLFISEQSPKEGVDFDPEQENQIIKPSVSQIESEHRVIEGSPMVGEYGEEGGSVEADLKVVMLVLQDSQYLVKDFDKLFLPDNAAIVNFLKGGNRDKLAWIPPNHRFVNNEGNLVDRWGNALFFHRESGFKFSLRSAGPDGRMWSEDDVVHD